MMGYEQMNPKTMTTTSMMKNFNKMEPINTPHKKTIRRSVSATDGGAAATACKRRRTSAESQNSRSQRHVLGFPLSIFYQLN
ncbi:hypothetical protein Bca4012_098173 [Brassica carinata]|uniref:(rape) hypothetical protein n=1 Tax=Brassica napus TaxID=3708 RepID=A0A078IZY3_BRANA|nr:unnamed protein product [Brassica napus]CDY56146.1 BnaC06g41350D [Brassica napus]